MSYLTALAMAHRPQPDFALYCSLWFWFMLMGELRRRCGAKHESGAFLLGNAQTRRLRRAVYYDDLDPHALDTGIIRFDGRAYGPLWRICEQHSLEVLADVHCHPGSAAQSYSDQANPMIPQRGHVAMIVPHFARKSWNLSAIGVFGYHGSGKWEIRRPPRINWPWSMELGVGR